MRDVVRRAVVVARRVVDGEGRASIFGVAFGLWGRVYLYAVY